VARFGGLVVAAAVLVAASCGGSDESDTGAEAVEALTPTTGVVAADDFTSIEVREDAHLVYLTDEFGDWTLRVFYPEAEGPWPLIVMIPPQQSVAYAGKEIARRGAVAVVADAWARPEAWSDPAPHLYGEMDRAACVVGWAQAHASDYGADPAATTVDGYSGGAMAAAWVGLGQADDSTCPDKIVELPIGLVLGESEFLFHHQRWDPYFESGDAEPVATIDGLINPDQWVVSPDLRVGLWSAEQPLGETRAIENPPGDDSWIWLRDGASPFMDDFVAVGALDDNTIDWSDNAKLMELRMEQSGIDVRNEVFPIPHLYKDQVYDLIFSIQP
jgi:hypothetical protein